MLADADGRVGQRLPLSPPPTVRSPIVFCRLDRRYF